MKRVVSVSLGSSKRNHAVETEFLGEKFSIERIGTDGDMEKAIALIRDLDGKVDAFGMGGIDLYIYAGSKRYVLRDARRIAQAARVTPIVDGSGLKNTLEQKVIEYVATNGIIPLKGRPVLMVCGVDRPGMARSLVAAGAQVTFGDLIFTLGIPIPLSSLRSLERVARIVAPIVSQIPFKYLYPTGDKQEEVVPKHAKYYQQAETVAGDFHFVRRYMPDDMRGKNVITNTVTPDDIEMLRQRGVKKLITTTPDLNGRSFGTNVMEGVLISLAGKTAEEICPDDYSALLDQIGLKPRVVDL